MRIAISLTSDLCVAACGLSAASPAAIGKSVTGSSATPTTAASRSFSTSL
jgi:hypothetical protein